MNSIPKSPNQNLNYEDGEGVGLANIKRRLELIYPKNHELYIKKESNTFIVRLRIEKNCVKISEINA
jgi:LytS/YehU family sensor histidine kinase